MSLSCPLDCEYLQEAHAREKPVTVTEAQLSNRDVKVGEEFLRTHEELLLFAIYSLVQAALRTPGAVDTDLLDALRALIQTHRTRDAGLVYETRAGNSIAVAVQRAFTTALEDYEKIREERESLSPPRNAEVMAILVFLHRLGQQNINGKPRGRMFIDMLRHMTPDTGVEERAPSIIL